MPDPTFFSPLFLSFLADKLLATAVTALTVPAASITPPVRQIVVHGQEPPWDCDQLAVCLTGIRAVRPAGNRGGIAPDRGPHEPCGLNPAAIFKVHLLRCNVPETDGETMDPAPPTVTQINDFGHSLLTDGWALWKGLVDAWAANPSTLFGATNPIPCHRTLIGEAQPLGPTGELAGWMIPITTTLA